MVDMLTPVRITAKNVETLAKKLEKEKLPRWKERLNAADPRGLEQAADAIVSGWAALRTQQDAAARLAITTFRMHMDRPAVEHAVEPAEPAHAGPPAKAKPPAAVP